MSAYLQVPLNETLRQEIASGYVSYEYSSIPGMVPSVYAGSDPKHGCAIYKSRFSQ